MTGSVAAQAVVSRARVGAGHGPELRADAWLSVERASFPARNETGVPVGQLRERDRWFRGPRSTWALRQRARGRWPPPSGPLGAGHPEARIKQALTTSVGSRRVAIGTVAQARRAGTREAPLPSPGHGRGRLTSHRSPERPLRAWFSRRRAAPDHAKGSAAFPSNGSCRKYVGDSSSFGGESGLLGGQPRGGIGAGRGIKRHGCRAVMSG